MVRDGQKTNTISDFIICFIGTTSAEEMENSCELVSRCEHGTACVGSHDDYYCDCPEGLEGEFCEINPSDCVGNPCQSIL